MSGETKIIYHVDEEETPYLVKIPKPPDQVTLGDFKNVINRPNYKFFFKSMDDDFGVVKEEIVDDDANLPCFNDRVVSWVVAPDDEEGSQNSGEATNLSRKNRDTDAESICSRRSTRSSRSRRYESETESRRRSSRRGDTRSDFDTTSMMSSDLEATSFVDSDEDSRMSAITDNSKYSHRQRRRRKKQRMPRVERCSSFSTITESTMSLNIITVVLNMDKINFLGISIVGQANKKGDGGIYVGSVMKGGAVDADGRIEPGDMILAVGDVNFENMSNDDAVRVLRECVHKPGPVMLTVAKCWDPNPKGMFTVPRNDVTRPIDPAAWMQHSEAVRASGGLMQGSPSMSTITSTSDSLTSSIPEADRYLDHTDLGLSTQTDMHTIVKVMASAESGLVIRDRMWLKITIKNAFIGSDLVDWLFTHVDGFQDRRDSRKYATKLLKAGLIKHTVKKETFSEQCYYVFGDLNLKPIDDMREAGDMLAPLPNNNQTGTWVGQSPYMLPPGSMMHPMMMAPRGPGSVTSQSEVSTIPPYQVMGAVGGADPPAYAEMYPQMYPGPAAPGQPYNPYFMQATHVGSQGSHHTGSSTGSGGSIRNQNLSLQHQQQMLAQQNIQLQQMLAQQHQQQQMLVRDLDQLTIRSGGSGSEKSHSSRGSRDSKRLVISPTEPISEPQTVELPNSQPQPPQADQTSPTDATISEAGKPPLIAAPPGQTTGEMVRELGKLETFPQEMSASRQSFRMAMGNTNNEFFVDVM